ncbi:MAG: hypothetical protein ACC656_13320, partial [Candidatus Heimdallarchaeota archaeon]
MEQNPIKVFDEIRESIEQDDIIRENIIKLSRQSIRKCSETIRATHRREFKNATSLLKESHDLTNQIANQLPKNGLFENNASVAFQEYIEALLLHNFVFNKDSPPIIPLTTVQKDIFIPYVAYLHGLCDLVGELRRFVLDSIRFNNLDDGERALEIMDELFSQLVTLDYPNALVPGIRRKTDLIRNLLEKTRGDITFTHNRLM